MEPDDATVEQYVDGNLSIYVDMPYIVARNCIPNLPTTGPDTLTITFADSLAQQTVWSTNCSMWMSDNGYVIISADNGKQYLIASVQGGFFDANAAAINARNIAANIPQLMPCANALRYDAPAVLPNQTQPQTWWYDGVLTENGSG
jgi:hypothetical protein